MTKTKSKFAVKINTGTEQWWKKYSHLLFVKVPILQYKNTVTSKSPKFKMYLSKSTKVLASKCT